MQLFAHVTAKLASIPVIPELGPATIFWPYGGTLAPRIHLGGGGKSGRAEICQSCEKEGTVSIARAGDAAMKLDQERYLAVWCGTGSRPHWGIVGPDFTFTANDTDSIETWSVCT